MLQVSAVGPITSLTEPDVFTLSIFQSFPVPHVSCSAERGYAKLALPGSSGVLGELHYVRGLTAYVHVL